MTKEISNGAAAEQMQDGVSAEGSQVSEDKKTEIPLFCSSWRQQPGTSAKVEDQSNVKDYNSITSTPETTADLKLYKYRFWILFLFSACALVNGLQWGQYTIMADVTKCFYGVDIYAVDWTANIFIILYIPLGFPVSWMMSRFGLRPNLILGSFCSCLGAAIQCLTLQPDTFALVMLSQAIAAVSLVFLAATPPYLAAVWFGPDELSSACATGVAADMAGVALSFIVTPMVVSHDCSNPSEISRGKGHVAYTLTGANLILFALVLGTFRNKPEKPPSLSQANKMDYVPSYKQSLMGLCKSRNFILLFITYGIFCGTTTSVGVIFNPIMLPHFPGKYTEIGWMSLTAVSAGIVGIIVTGVILDQTHAFKKLQLILNTLMTGSLVIYAALVETNILWIQFITNAILGFIANSHFSVGLEFAAEITYPEPELVVTYLMNVSSTIFSVAITMIGSWIEETRGNIALFSFFEALLIVGTVITAFTKCNSKRSEQNQIKETQEN